MLSGITMNNLYIVDFFTVKLHRINNFVFQKLFIGTRKG